MGLCSDVLCLPCNILQACCDCITVLLCCPCRCCCGCPQTSSEALQEEQQGHHHHHHHQHQHPVVVVQPWPVHMAPPQQQQPVFLATEPPSGHGYEQLPAGPKAA